MLSDIAAVGAFCTLLTAEAAGGVRDDLQPALAKAAKVGADAAVIIGDFDATQRSFNRSILGNEVRDCSEGSG